MAVGLGEELHTTGLVELLQLLQHLGCMILQLLHAHAREREGHFEELAVVTNHVVQGVESGHVAALGYVADATLVLVVIVIVVVGTDVEEAVAFQMDNLMYFEI